MLTSVAPGLRMLDKHLPGLSANVHKSDKNTLMLS